MSLETILPRPVYWSVRRELWENRSTYIAPLAVSVLVMFAGLITTAQLAHKLDRAVDVAARQRLVSIKHLNLGASAILFTGFVVAVIYCIDALSGERRDRSILFWKSMPVSDHTTVLVKAGIPMIVIPAFVYGLAIVTQWANFFLTSIAIVGTGVDPMPLRLALLRTAPTMLYGLVAHVLWYAPIYGWLLLVSAWAKRAPLVWATVPFFGLFVLESAVGTNFVVSLIKYRAIGAMAEAFNVDATRIGITRFSQLEPVRFLTSPGLWGGLMFAAFCVAGAIWLRRNREP